MNTPKQYREKYLSIFFGSALLLLFLFAYGWYSTVSQNHEKKTVLSTKPDKKIEIQINTDTQRNDNWETEIKLSEDPERVMPFIGETCACTIVNGKSHYIKNWTLKLNIQQDCYLNGFWCGDFEVHQFRDGKENVQRVKNSPTDTTYLNLEHNEYSTNMMIHLIPGDYLVYYPSEEVQEDILKPGTTLGIGFIFYFQNALNLRDFEFNYFDSVRLFQSVFFKVFIVLSVIWLIGLFFFHAFLLIDKKILDEKEHSIRNISIMAELYQEVHMLNLETNTGYLVKGNPENLLFNFLGYRVQDYFGKYIEEDCKEEYKVELSKFLDLSVAKELLKNSQSLSFEYESLKKGWCLLRFFKMEKNNKIYQLIFTVQDINEEKRIYEEEQEKIKQHDFQQFFHNTFMKTFNGSTLQLLNGINAMSENLLKIALNDEQKMLASAVNNSLEHYRLLQDCVYDMYALEADNFTVHNEEYNLKETIERVSAILAPFHMNKPFQYIVNVDANIPDVLEGDRKRLMQILLLLLFSSFFITQQGTVKLSIFAKREGDTEELLFSIKDSAEGFDEEQMKEVYSFLAGSRINSFENPSLVYLKIIDGILKNMDSELKMVSVFGSGTEFYFAVKQKVIK